jgi:integrase
MEWQADLAHHQGAHRGRCRDRGSAPDVTPHTWRHTVATWLMQDGADPFKAAGFLGMSVETLLARLRSPPPGPLGGRS